MRSLLKQENRHASHPSAVTQVVHDAAVSNRGRGHNGSPEGETGQEKAEAEGERKRKDGRQDVADGGRRRQNDADAVCSRRADKEQAKRRASVFLRFCVLRRLLAVWAQHGACGRL